MIAKNFHLLLGQRAEKQAAEAVKQAGYEILSQNFNTKFGEIDLICKTARELIFIEVRFRSNADFGQAIETVTATKQRKIIRAAQIYLQQNPKLNQLYMRFDVIGINADNQINWIEGAFQAI